MFLPQSERPSFARNLNTIKKNTKFLLYASNKASLELSAEKNNQNAGKNHNVDRINKSFKNVVKFKYFITAVVNENYIYKYIMSK
jgi:hypothetical protein